jgi:predicted Na+-dependent transporter
VQTRFQRKSLLSSLFVLSIQTFSIFIFLVSVKVLPLVSIIGIVAIVAAVVSVNQQNIAKTGLIILLLLSSIMSLAIYWAISLESYSKWIYRRKKQLQLKLECKTPA